MVTFRQIAIWAVCLLALLFFGSLGFVWLEGWNFFDALYMTVTTLSTVGYGEVHPLSPLGKIYNMGLILAGMGVLAYIITSMARVVVEGEIKAALGKRKLLKHIKKLSGHYIICGFGRIGEIIARQLQERGVPLVVVDNKPENLARLEQSGYYLVAGDATREEVLQDAGIERARGLVAVVSSDADNVYIVLTARSISPNLHIVARGREKGAEGSCCGPGPTGWNPPTRWGAADGLRHPASYRDHLHRTGHAGGGGPEHGGDRGGPGSSLAGVALKDSGIRQKLDLILVAIKRSGGEMLFNPTLETPILAGDTLIALGLREKSGGAGRDGRIAVSHERSAFSPRIRGHAIDGA